MCAAKHTTAYRTLVDVDLVGMSDPNDKEWSIVRKLNYRT